MVTTDKAEISPKESRIIQKYMDQFKGDMVNACWRLGHSEVSTYDGRVTIIAPEDRFVADREYVHVAIRFTPEFRPQGIEIAALEDRSVTKMLVPREVDTFLSTRHELTEAVSMLEKIEEWAKNHGVFLANFRNSQYTREGLDIYALGGLKSKVQ